jgi:serine/threonine-protein kinase HipA
MSTEKELAALLGGREVGRVRQDQRGRLTFTYDDRWRRRRDAYPLSLSMPLAAAEHGHAVVEAFLWGLLPDNSHILDRWGRRFRVSARSAFALLANVGEDCAGAVQFVRPERLDVLLGVAPAPVRWLDAAAVAERLRALRGDASAWRQPGDTGQFSLAAGRMPTTHILKPPTGDLDGHVENEHFCLALARELGLPAAASEVMRFDDEVAIVIERYDRLRREGAILRVHQEDVCQALGVPPMKKYESEGGPGARQTVELLRAHSSARDEDVNRLVDALALNWLIAGPDAHAKNYSVLLGAAGRMRLAPLYDLASALPYPQLDKRRMTLAMKLGGEYRLHAIGPRQWRKLATELHLDHATVVARVQELAERIPASAATVKRRAVAGGLRHPIVDRLPALLEARAAQCATLLARG